MRLAPSTTVASRYAILRPLGVGGLGSVYLVEDLLRGREVALKIVEVGRREHLDAFRQEFATLSSLFHPCLAQVFGFGRALIAGNPCIFYTSRFVDGEPIDGAARGRRWADIFPALVDGVKALRFLHIAGIRHGDFKPDNLLIDRNGRGTLIDLSCSGDLPPGTIAGTRGYLAPELFKGGGGVDHRADLYSVGRTIDELRRLVDDVPDLDEVVQRLTRSDPSDRPGDVDELLSSLGAEVSDEVVPNQRSPFVGREPEAALVAGLLERLVTGRAGPRAVCFHGQEGVGRSRLLQEFLWQAQLRVMVIEGDSRRPDAIADMLRRSVGGDARDHHEQIVTDREPVMLVLDDAQELANDQRVILRSFLQRLTETGHIGVMVTNRSAVLLEGLEAPATSVALEPLGVEALEIWLQGLRGVHVPAGRFKALHRATRGLPREIHSLFSLIKSGSEDFSALLRKRSTRIAPSRRSALRNLPTHARRILGICAALDGVLPGWTLENMSESRDSLAPLISTGWLVMEGERDELRLTCLADVGVIEDSIGARTGKAIHRELATWLEARSQDIRSKAELIRHLAFSGSIARAKKLLLDARESFPGAPRAYRRAAEVIVEIAGSTEVIVALAELHELCGEPRRALDVVEGLEGSLPAVALRRGSASLLLGEAQAARDHLAEALDVESAPVERARIADLSCRAMIQIGDYKEALELADHTLKWAETPDVIGDLHEDLGVAQIYLGEYVEARRHLDEAATIHGEGERQRGQIRALSYRAILEYRLGRFKEAVEPYQRALDLAEAVGLVDQSVSCALNLGTVLHRLGEWGSALDAYERGLEMAIAVGGNLRAEVALRTNLAQLHCDLGRFERASQVLERAQHLSKEGDLSFFVAACEMLDGEITFFRGQPSESGQLFDRARELFAAQGANREVADAELLLTERALALDDHEQAQQHLDAAEAAANRCHATDLSARATLLSGKLALAAGRAEEALTTLEHALAKAETGEERDFLAEIEGWLAKAYDARAAPRVARRHRERALELWERCAATLSAASRDLLWRHPRRAHVSAASSVEYDAPNLAAVKSSREKKLERLLAINARLSSSLKTKEVLLATMDAAVELTGAERGFLILAPDQRRGSGKLKVAVARNLDQERIGRSSMKFSRSIAEKVLETGEPVLTAEALSDDRFATTRSVQAMKLKSVMSVPIHGPKGILGALYVDNRFGRGMFSQEDLEILIGFADQAGIALTNARLHDELDARTRELERERRRIAKSLEERTREVGRLERQMLETQHAYAVRSEYSGIIGRSRPMQTVFATIDRVAQSSFTVLIQGESGTGKELIARAIHNNSPRTSAPFVTVNCGAIPETLLESELFGHLKGAFTGADQDREGLLVHARDGTIFLDEIGELPLGMQAKLLRVLQEREVLPLGSTRPRTVSARILCATNRRLGDEVAAGRFREDLFYRLAVVVIEMPPLRERLDDIPELVQHLLRRLAVEADRSEPSVTPEALRRLLSFSYPGNVRQLENVLSQALIFCVGDTIDSADIVLPDLPRREQKQDFEEYRAIEAAEIAAALKATRWNVTEVSRLLSIPRTSLYRKLKHYGLSRKS